ncbi:MAG: hypothetical protein MMC33_000965 [Icmadophila ericetorum]|nr:hypothetical protein [Icmadophila ericetorum]
MAAAVSIPPSPHAIGVMTNRRDPLADRPNVANSPFRAVVAAAAKRARPESSIAADSFYGQPPSKKQALELEEARSRKASRTDAQYAEGGVFNDKLQDPAQTSFNRRLMAVKERAAGIKVAANIKNEKTVESMESMRLWRTNQRRHFPKFVFYFDSIPEDHQRELSRLIGTLDARQERFFSKEVTHVVTTRSIPTPASTQNASTNASSIGKAHLDAALQEARSQREATRVGTINPSLLQKHPEQSLDFQSGVSKASSRHVGEFRKPSFANFEEVELRRQRAANTDILLKALEMGMKIWPIEKLEKILSILLDDADDVHNKRGGATMANAARAAPQPDLSKLIQNEQINGPSDRESVLAASEIILFKGPYLMIRDMTERVKPIMYREWTAVADREDGEWPQFRSVSAGKCPFLDEHAPSRRELARRKQEEEQEQLAAKVLINNKTTQLHRATASVEPTKMNPPVHATRSRQNVEAMQQAKTIAPPPKPAQLPSVAPALQGQEGGVESADGFKHPAGGHGPGFIRGEPMASGMQQSNVTSAIRSQVISSTAAAPGAKAGMSKEVHELKRKVLERNNPILMSKGLEKLNARANNLMNTMGSRAQSAAPQLRGVNAADNSASAKMIPPPRVAKQKAQEKIAPKQLVNIQEEENTDEEDFLRQQQAIAEWRMKRDPKPGYCENCKEKFDDFEEHCAGRKHRKFATTQENWADLDGLLGKLVRPLREEDSQHTIVTGGHTHVHDNDN